MLKCLSWSVKASKLKCGNVQVEVFICLSCRVESVQVVEVLKYSSRIVEIECSGLSVQVEVLNYSSWSVEVFKLKCLSHRV